MGDFRLGLARGNYYTYPPNFGVDGPAEIGLGNVPSDAAIMGGMPKFNIQGFDAVGRHTSTPQFQTPRSWNPRVTFSWNHGAHFVKFGGEFLHVQTRINDLNATIGRLNFDNRFTNRAVGDLLLGLPSQLALTSYTVMDQGQDMQFYFVQDDYKLTSSLTINVGLRYEYATPPREKDNSFANFDPVAGQMIFATDGDVFDRALIHPDRNNFAPRIGFAYTPGPRWVIRSGYGVFYSHTVRQGREGLLGFNPPYLVDNLLQTSVSGAAAVASAAPFRLVNGYPSGLLDPTSLATTVSRRAQDANQRTPYVQQYNFGIQYELMTDLLLDLAYVGNKGTKLNGFRNLNQASVITNANGSQSAGPRPYPAFGDIQWMENRVDASYNSLQARLEKRFSHGLSALVSYTWGKALTESPDHISTSGGGAGFDTGTFREPQDGNNLQAERGLAEFDVKHRFVASYIWELPFGQGRRYGNDWSTLTNALLGGWQLTGIHADAERARLDGDAWRRVGARHRRRTTGPAQPRRRARAARIGADGRPMVQHGRVRGLQPRAAGLRDGRRRHHARARHVDVRLHAGEGLRGRRPTADPVPLGGVQRLQPRELRPAEHRPRVERLRPDPDRRAGAHHAVRAQVLLLMMRGLLAMGGVVAVVIGAAAAPPAEPRADAAFHHWIGVEHHLQRRLDDAARAYARALALDPPRDPTADEDQIIRRFLPRLYANAAEPFALKDVAAVLHPERRLIAYHLFWEDDIEFPEDNDPCDHELMWVAYSADGQQIEQVWTYFHGRRARRRRAGPARGARARPASTRRRAVGQARVDARRLAGPGLGQRGHLPHAPRARSTARR